MNSAAIYGGYSMSSSRKRSSISFLNLPWGEPSVAKGNNSGSKSDPTRVLSAAEASRSRVQPMDHGEASQRPIIVLKVQQDCPCFIRMTGRDLQISKAHEPNYDSEE